MAREHLVQQPTKRKPHLCSDEQSGRLGLVTPPENIVMKKRNRIIAFILTALMALSLGCASTAKHEGTGEYIDDSVITTKVKAMLFDEPTLKSGEINVETFKGVVQLSGFVSSQANIDTAVVVARKVNGVKMVNQDMRVK